MSDATCEIPSHLRQIFGKRPIMLGEDPAVYDDLLNSVVAEVAPETLAEYLLAKDAADAEWELLRLRGMKAGMVNVLIFRELRLPSSGDASRDRETLAQLRENLHRVLRGDQDAQRSLDDLLAKHQLTLEGAAAAAFDRNIMPQAQTDRMIGAALARRNQAYAELERLRAKKPPAPQAKERDLPDVADGEQFSAAPQDPVPQQPAPQRPARVTRPVEEDE